MYPQVKQTERYYKENPVLCENYDKLLWGTQHKTMSGDYFTHNDRQTKSRPMYSTLKWTEDGELSSLDMSRILEALESHEEKQE